MFAIFIDAVRAFVSAVTDARSLALSNLALRHQLGVLEHQGAMPTSIDTDRPNALGLALADMVRMEGHALNRSPRDRDRVASPGMAAVLDVAKQAAQPWASDDFSRSAQAHPRDVRSQRHVDERLACTANS
jgi:hypothetical protein